MAPVRDVVGESSSTSSREDQPPVYTEEATPQNLPPDLSERLSNLRLDPLNGVCTSLHNMDSELTEPQKDWHQRIARPVHCAPEVPRGSPSSQGEHW
jgi:hypothetical protein